MLAFPPPFRYRTQTVKKSPPQTRINLNHLFEGVYLEKVLCGPNPARSPSSKKWRSLFFEINLMKKRGHLI